MHRVELPLQTIKLQIKLSEAKTNVGLKFQVWGAFFRFILDCTAITSCKLIAFEKTSKSGLVSDHRR